VRHSLGCRQLQRLQNQLDIRTLVDQQVPTESEGTQAQAGGQGV
jgi:hypothetical protein